MNLSNYLENHGAQYVANNLTTYFPNHLKNLLVVIVQENEYITMIYNNNMNIMNLINIIIINIIIIRNNIVNTNINIIIPYVHIIITLLWI